MRYLLALALIAACGSSEEPTGNEPSDGSDGAAGMSSTERVDAGAADGGETTTRCGNGVVEPGESCDFGIAGGNTGSCPVSCDDDDPCTDDRVVGERCQTACLNVPQGGICNPQEPEPELPFHGDSVD